MALFNFRSLLLMLFLFSGFGSAQSVFAQQMQMDARIGHIAMPTFGRDTGISHLEFMPYILEENESIFFGDLRGFLSNEGKGGGNIGAGYRFLGPNSVLVMGAHGSYTVDQTSQELYQQMVFGLEGMTRFGSVTSNFYFPIGEDEKKFETRIGDPFFQGNQVLLQTLDTVGQAMRGFDLNFGVFLPGEFAEEHNMEATASWYHFEGERVDAINGVKVLLEGQVVPTIDAQVALTNDDTFGTNVTVGMSFRFGNNDIPDRRLDAQLRSFIDTNYNVIVGKRIDQGAPTPLINPLTDQEFRVQHVDSSAGTGGSGSLEDPFQTVAAAQNAGADLIVLKGGSIFADDVVLQDGEMLLGEGRTFTFETENFGELTFEEDLQIADVVFQRQPLMTIQPVIVNTGPVMSLNQPNVMMTSTPHVQMADNSALAGVIIESTPGSLMGDSLTADGIDNFRIENVTINQSEGSGLVISQSDHGFIKNLTVNEAGGVGVAILDHEGYLEFDNVTVTDSQQHGIYVNGGTGDTVFSGTTTLTGSDQSALRVRDLELVTTVDDQGTLDTSDDIEEDIFGRIAIEKLIIDGAQGAKGIELTDNVGLVDIFDLQLESTGATGVESHQSELINIRSGSIATTGASAVDVEDSDVNFQISSISADGGTYGIRMVNTEGQIIAVGDGTEDSGGTIQNTDIALMADHSGSIGVRNGNFVNNDRIAVVTDSDVLDLNTSRFKQTQVSFIEATNVKLFSVSNSLFEENNLSGDTGIDYIVNQTGGFVARVTRNTVEESPKVFFNSETQAGGAGASLEYSFIGNAVTLSEASAVAARMDWTGPINANVNENLVTGELAGQKAFQFATGSSSDESVFTFSQNALGFSGRNATAIELLAGSATDFAATNNIIEFQGLDGTGVRVSAAQASEILVANNLIDDYAGGATGLLFPSLHDGSVLNLNANVITLNRYNTFVDRGIILSNVTGTDDPFVTLLSSLTNEILGATTEFSVPANQTTGRILINGQVAQ